MNAELATIEEQVAETPVTASPISVQQRVAQNDQLLASIAPTIKKNHVIMHQGKSYVCVAGGIAIANALGFTIATDEVVAHNDDDGKYYSAVASLIDSTTGLTIGKATGYVGMDESRWSDAPLYARRSMTSTRAVARLLRQNFGHFYVALGHSDTPLEELPDVPDGSQSTKASNKFDKATEPAPDGDQTLTVTAVDDWSKDGADWTKFTITTGEGYQIVTFKDNEADIAKNAKDSGGQVIVRFVGPNQYGTYDLKHISAVKATKKATTKKASKIDEVPKEEDIPF